jgi:nitrogen fixation NifU-like protein
MVYNYKIIDLAENPEHIGSMEEDDPNVGVGQDGAAACGDLLRVYIRVNQKNIIEDVKFKIFGCGSAIASSEFMAKNLIGKSLNNLLDAEEFGQAQEKGLQSEYFERVDKDTNRDHLEQKKQNTVVESTTNEETENFVDLENLNSYIAAELKLPPVKFHCSVLAKDAITNAINDLKRKRQHQ